MPERDPKKFDPARAHVLDSPERERYLPTDRLVELLELRGGETVVDYGAGTGRLTVPVAAAVPGGRVVGVDESDEMIALLGERLADVPNAYGLAIAANEVDLPDASADRVLAVNLLHEVRGERALAEMRRLLKPDGFVLVVDWERGHEREVGPPDEILYSEVEAIAELAANGLAATPAGADLPYHFALVARPEAKEAA